MDNEELEILIGQLRDELAATNEVVSKLAGVVDEDLYGLWDQINGTTDGQWPNGVKDPNPSCVRSSINQLHERVTELETWRSAARQKMAWALRQDVPPEKREELIAWAMGPETKAKPKRPAKVEQPPSEPVEVIETDLTEEGEEVSSAVEQ